MNDLVILGNQVRYEQKAYWRNPTAAFFSFAFPIMFLVIFATINKGAQVQFGVQRMSYDDFFIPSILAFGVMSACYTNLAIGLVTRREAGILKKLRGTPLPAWTLFGGLLGSALIIAAILTVVTGGAGRLLYGVTLPHHPVALVVTILLGGAVFTALGVAVSTLVPDAEAAPAVVNFPYFLLVFLSSIFFPAPPGSIVARIGDVFPLAHFTSAARTAYLTVGGTGVNRGDLVNMTIWFLVAMVIALRRFRWEPHGR
ncbi:MAG: ABC transporter permease [Actinomycetes bacterium]